jgi:tetratricopeptide (TPR) repeat protein
MNKQQGKAQKKEKPRHGEEFGSVLRMLLRHPPHLEPPRKVGFFWKPDPFGLAIGGASGSAVRQWLRGEYLPEQFITGIIKVLFGPNPDRYADQLSQLMQAFERGQDLRDGRKITHETERNNSIPRLTPYFIGRDNERDRLVEEILSERSGAILIQGGPGMGKTELTKAVAKHERIVERFGDRRWFVRLETATTAEAMQQAIARELGCDPKNGFQTALHFLSAQPSLVVLDNLETPWEPFDNREAIADMLAELGDISNLTIAASVRGFEDVGGVRWFNHSVLEFSFADASLLFAEIGGDWVLQDSNLPKFIEALGGIPLAINLVAHRARGRRLLAPLWREWEKIGVDYIKRRDSSAASGTSLPFSIELSLNGPRIQKTRDALRLFAMLGALPAGLRSEDRDALLGWTSLDAEECLVATGLAIERSGRLDLLPPIRSHALKHRVPTNLDTVKWVDWFLEYSSRHAELPLDDFYRAIDHVNEDYRNVEAAILKAPYKKAARQIDSFNRLSERTWQVSTVPYDILKLSELNGDSLTQAKCLRGLAEMMLRSREIEAAQHVFKRAKSIYEREGDLRGCALCLLGLGEANRAVSRFLEARGHYQESLGTFESMQDTTLVAKCLLSIAHAEIGLSRFESAREYYSRALTKFELLNATLGEARCLSGLGTVEYYSNGEAALIYFEESLIRFREIGDKQGEGSCLRDIAGVRALKGD